MFIKHVVTLVCFVSFCAGSVANPVIPLLGIMQQQQRARREESLRRIEEINKEIDRINERINEIRNQREMQERINKIRNQNARKVVSSPQDRQTCFSQVLDQLTAKEPKNQRRLNTTCLFNLTQEDKNYLLFLSAYHGKVQSAQALIDSGAQISSAQGDLKNTPCHSATRQGQIAVLSLFLNYEPDSCDMPNIYGETPFHYALKWEQPEAIALLYEYGIYDSDELFK